jgi:hypothetical protein
MKKLIIIILVLLFPALALAQDKCCVLGSGKCMPLKGPTDEGACQMLKGNIVSVPCEQAEQCNKPGTGKCCIQEENQRCFGVNTPAAAAACKGKIIDCQCPPHCKPSCEP